MIRDDRLAPTRCFRLDMDGTMVLGARLIEGTLKFIDILQRHPAIRREDRPVGATDLT